WGCRAEGRNRPTRAGAQAFDSRDGARSGPSSLNSTSHNRDVPEKIRRKNPKEGSIPPFGRYSTLSQLLLVPVTQDESRAPGSVSLSAKEQTAEHVCKIVVATAVDRRLAGAAAGLPGLSQPSDAGPRPRQGVLRQAAGDGRRCLLPPGRGRRPESAAAQRPGRCRRLVPADILSAQ